jgi:tyrosyl-tRNA synthetase
MFYGKEEAKAAQEHFTQTFSKRAFPEDAPSISLTSKTEATVLDILHACDTGKSNSELRRLIAQSAVSINGEKQTDATTTIMLDHRLELKIGKRGFYLYEPAN